MGEFAYQAYLELFWPLMAICGARAFWKHDSGMIRCIILLVSGQVAVDYWFAELAPHKWGGQPWHIYLAVYLASCILVTIRPAGRTCSIMGGVFLSGVLISIVRAMFPASEGLDWAFWQANLAVGWMSLAVVIGGTGHEGGRRVLSGVRRGVAHLAHAADRRGVAG